MPRLFGRTTWSPNWLTIPHQEPPQRTMCRECLGGGTINGVPCRARCDNGWLHLASGRPQQRQPDPESEAW
jgi:hypothetical protein